MVSNTLILKYNDEEFKETGKWNGMDQLSEIYASTSPFAYVANNPVSMRDPDGRWMDANGHIDTSGNSNPFRDMAQSQMRMTQFMGRNPGEGGAGGYLNDSYNFTGTQAFSMFNYFKNGGSMSGLSFGDTEVTWYTGTATQDAYRMGDDIFSDIKLGIIHKARIAKNSWAEIRTPSYYLPPPKSFDWGHVGNTMTAGAVTYFALEKSIYSKYHWVDAKGIIKSTQLLEKGANGKYVRGVQGFRNGYMAAGKATSAYSIAGKVVGAVGMGATVFQYFDGQITGTEASVDLAMGAIGFTGWGAPISLAYFSGKFLYEYSTGRSLFTKPGEN
ncbi:hypothetical protein C8D70_1197 [Chryseobacterium sp. CBTAP 102]|nr:hypothetical protein [Chryseobacterium sp. CBTAP 102]PXW08003.1 hypothetical protein C8D70_1197 [Chryseobacterium sp. CBTAP 102]